MAHKMVLISIICLIAISNGFSFTIQKFVSDIIEATPRLGPILLFKDLNDDRKQELLNKRTDKLHRIHLQRTRIDGDLEDKRNEIKQINKEIKQIKLEIESEERKIFSYNHNIINNEHVKFMVALGFTGHGKSTVLNRLCGDFQSPYGDDGPFKADDSDQSGLNYAVNTIDASMNMIIMNMYGDRGIKARAM